MKGSSKILVGFLAGVAAGAGIYALLKSEKGQELVNELKDVAGKWKDEIETILSKGKETAEDMVDDAEEELGVA